MSEDRMYRKGVPGFNKIAQRLYKMFLDANTRFERFLANHSPKPVEFASVEFRKYAPVIEGWYLKKQGEAVTLTYVNDRLVYAMGERPALNDGYWAGPVLIPSGDIPPATPTPDYINQTNEELAT